jgi:hypothetical protein
MYVVTVDYLTVGAIMFCWGDYAVCMWFYGFITEMPKGEFVSYFISSWLFFSDQNFVIAFIYVLASLGGLCTSFME